MRNPITEEQPTDRAYLVGVERDGRSGKRFEPLPLAAGDGGWSWPSSQSLEELAQLARTAGMRAVGRCSQRLDTPDPASYVRSGKLREAVLAAQAAGAGTVLFDDELSPGQLRNIERVFGEDFRVVDRTALILDVFSRHARTREGKLQVELAQYRYRLPRLTRMWTHLARQAGARSPGPGGGRSSGSYAVGFRGPGETQLESDRRQIKRRIVHLEALLERVRVARAHERRRRERRELPVVALVGYTNAGKSSLLNAIAHTAVPVEDKLFATLDPTTRRVRLPGGRIVLMSDTVGFISKLPPFVVASFRATLEEVADADVLVHVADLSHPMVDAQVATVRRILADIGAGEKDVLVAWNKVDLCGGLNGSPEREGEVRVSAARGTGIDALLREVERLLDRSLETVEVEIPYARGALLNEIHQRGVVESCSHESNGTRIRARVPVGLARRLRTAGVAAKP